MDRRLFLPESWFDADHAERRDKCRVPKDVTFRSKPELAADMLRAIQNEGQLPFRYIVADSIYGNSPVFLDAMEACVGRVYMVGISSESRCWLQRPQTQRRSSRYGGENFLLAAAGAPTSLKQRNVDTGLVVTCPAVTERRRRGHWRLWSLESQDVMITAISEQDEPVSNWKGIYQWWFDVSERSDGLPSW